MVFSLSLTPPGGRQKQNVNENMISRHLEITQYTGVLSVTSPTILDVVLTEVTPESGALTP
jgi:hypothetical protein